MRLIYLMIAVAVSSSTALSADDGAARKELLGTWVGGVDQGATGHKLTITATHITGRRDEKQYLGEGMFQLDRSQKPWQLDATGTKGSPRGKKFLGIYALEGETLKWCVSAPGSERPTDFTTKEGQFLLILKRQQQ